MKKDISNLTLVDVVIENIAKHLSGPNPSKELAKSELIDFLKIIEKGMHTDLINHGVAPSKILIKNAFQKYYLI